MHTFLIITHIIGAVMGVGGATSSDILFFRALKKGKIESAEFESLKKFSLIIWLGFTVLAFSGISFFIFYRLNMFGPAVAYSPKLWAHFTIALVVFFNGLVMHWKVFPLIESGIGKPLFSENFIKKSFVVFSTGAISILSWYSAFILGMSRTLDLSYLKIIGVYFIIILVGIVIANIVGRRIIKNQ